MLRISESPISRAALSQTLSMRQTIRRPPQSTVELEMTLFSQALQKIVCWEGLVQTVFLAVRATIQYWARLMRTQFPAMREMIPFLAEMVLTASLVAMETIPSLGGAVMIPCRAVQAAIVSLEAMATTTILYLQFQVPTFMKWPQGARTQSPPSLKTTHSDPSWRF